MSIYDVGVENLPNVYIDRIKMIIKSSSYKFQVTCLIYDDINNSTWFDRPEMASMKVKTVLVYNPELATSLKTGRSSLHNLTGKYGDGYVAEQLNANSFFESQGYNIESITQAPTERSFLHTFDFENINRYSLLPQLTNAVVFTACFMDNLGFENDLFNKYYGPMSSEIIITANEINTQSGYFFFPDTDEEYGGPVHAHQGGFMEGSQHRSDPHRALRFVPEDNAKLVTVLEGVVTPSATSPNTPGEADVTDTLPTGGERETDSTGRAKGDTEIDTNLGTQPAAGSTASATGGYP